jgi:hypothetical protein
MTARSTRYNVGFFDDFSRRLSRKPTVGFVPSLGIRGEPEIILRHSEQQIPQSRVIRGRGACAGVFSQEQPIFRIIHFQ